MPLRKTRWFQRFLRSIFRFQDSQQYWSERYRADGTSGEGSYGDLAKFKAHTLNAFVAKNRVTSIIEFGCGDGNQLSLAEYPQYIGFDIAPGAIERCRTRFSDDDTKCFHLLIPEQWQQPTSPYKAELSLSLDVIYHLVEDDVYTKHLDMLFSSASRFVIIYSSDTQFGLTLPHVHHRRFSIDVASRYPDWRLEQEVANPCAASPGIPDSTRAHFFIYAHGEPEE